MKLKLFAACGIAAGCFCVPALAQVTASPAPVVATPPSAVAAQPIPQVVSGSTLPINTDVWLTLDQKIDSHFVKLGDQLKFRVERDVMLGNYIVIPRGTPASGHVSMRSGRGMFGKSAKLDFDVDTIDLAGHPVPVSGHFHLDGHGNTGATLGAVAAAGLIGGVFVKGRSATAAEGSEWKVSTKDPVTVTVGGAQ